jgi:hypothetical protein
MAVYHMALIVWLLDNPEVKTVSASTYQETAMDEKRRKGLKASSNVLSYQAAKHPLYLLTMHKVRITDLLEAGALD